MYVCTNVKKITDCHIQFYCAYIYQTTCPSLHTKGLVVHQYHERICMTVSAADIHWGDGNGSNMTVSAADIHWGDGNGSNKVLSLSLGLGPCYEHCSLSSSSWAGSLLRALFPFLFFLGWVLAMSTVPFPLLLGHLVLVMFTCPCPVPQMDTTPVHCNHQNIMGCIKTLMIIMSFIISTYTRCSWCFAPLSELVLAATIQRPPYTQLVSL